MRFSNLVVATGSGTLANAAGEKLRGIELETRYQVTADLLLAASASYHDAQFTKYLFNDGESSVDVAGKQLVLSPHVLASAGFLYTPSQGFGSIFIAKYVGRRFLDEKNSARQGGYTTLDATLSDTFGRWRMTLEGTNLTDRRPPVSASEFGSQSFYLLAGRMLWLRLAYHWR